MQTLFADLRIPHAVDVPLGPLTWYGVGGRAKILAHPSSVQQLSALLARAYEAHLPVYVLGSGANLLVADAGVPGVVVRLDDPAFRQVSQEGNVLTVGAGHDLARLVLQAAKSGLAGLECLAGIPASVGGAVRMNAGGSYGDIGRCVRRLEVMDASGQVYYRERDDLSFTYRKTNIVAKCIVSAEFELAEDDPQSLMRQVKRIFLFKKSTQPLADRSAGCAFKNPPRPEGFDEDAPAGGGGDASARLSAGWLIDRAGLKGFRVGGAWISDHHANFIVADAGCTAADVLAVMEHAQRAVLERFGIQLEREVVVWP